MEDEKTTISREEYTTLLAQQIAEIRSNHFVEWGKHLDWAQATKEAAELLFDFYQVAEK